MVDSTGPGAPERGNWGRWGADDERGAANLVTPEVVKSAMASVRTGEVLSLALPIDGSTSSPQGRRVPHIAGRPLPQHFMSIDGGDYAAGARKLRGDMGMSDDALAHVWRGERLYNGHSETDVRSNGARRCGIDKLGPIVTRGVLLDVAGYLSVDALAPDVLIDADLLSLVAESAGVLPGRGDVVLIRTGWVETWDGDAARFSGRQPGLDHSGVQWLLERDVVAIGADNIAVGAIDEAGGFWGSVDEDVHLTALWAYGAPLLEMLRLDELARRGRSDFLFSVAPLPVVGGTASPVAPTVVL